MTTLTNNIVDVALIFVGAVLLPIYIYIYQYNPVVFSMLQCIHVILLCLYAILYVNYIRQSRHYKTETRERYHTAFNCIVLYTLAIFAIFFFMFMFKVYLATTRP